MLAQESGVTMTAPSQCGLARRRVIQTYVTVCNYGNAADAILEWASQGSGTFTTCHVNSHCLANGYYDPLHQDAMNSCDLVTPDGAPVVKSLQRLGAIQTDRVYGPDLMEVVCGQAAAKGIPVGIYGGRAHVLDALEKALLCRHPGLQIVYKHSPPFRPLTSEEQLSEDQSQADSGARIFFIGLGCPKQELYVHGKKLRGVPGVFMAVGAAIDINSGLQRKCPKFMQNHGLEWLYRLVLEPKRLWKRYAKYPLLYLLLDLKTRRGG